MLPKLDSSSSFNSAYLSNLFASENDIPMVRRSLDVDAEYTEAFHTKSFLNIWAEAHEQPKPTPSPTNFQPNSSSSSSSSNFLLEPSQSSLLAAATASGGGAALLDYLDATLQSSSACAVLLTAINRTRSIDRSVRHHLHRHAGGAASAAADLSAYIDLGNPLSPQNLSPFHRTHSLYPPLLARLTQERRRIRRAVRAVRAAKKATGIVIIAAVGTAAVLLTHAAAAVVAAAAVPALWGGWRRRWRRWVSVEWMERAGRKVDAAARGAYIVGRDMDTVSRMVRRVHDEMEHRRHVVRLMLRSSSSGDELGEMMARELEMGQVGFEEQIEELEEHVYLCLLTINRSRRLVHASSMH